MSSERENLTKVKEWIDIEGHERDEYGDWHWPDPPSFIESVAGGNLRADILRRLGRSDDEGLRVHLIESEITGGYSEYTVEMDYGVEVWLHEGRQSQRVFESDMHYVEENAFAALMKWIGETS